MMSFNIEFPGTNCKAVCLSDGANLSESLTVVNSPVLFGCRTGICGTCLVQIEDGYATLSPPDVAEREALEIYAPENGQARLACQINLNSNIALTKIESM